MSVKGKSYTVADVDAVEARIRRECPMAHISRENFDFTLCVAKPDRSAAFVVFDAGPAPHRAVIGDVDLIIAELNTP